MVFFAAIHRVGFANRLLWMRRRKLRLPVRFLVSVAAGNSLVHANILLWLQASCASCSCSHISTSGGSSYIQRSSWLLQVSRFVELQCLLQHAFELLRAAAMLDVSDGSDLSQVCQLLRKELYAAMSKVL